MSNLAAIVIIPAVFGGLGVYHEDLKIVFGPGITFCIWVGAVVLLGFFAVRLHLPEKSIHSLLVQSEELSEAKTNLETNVAQLESAIKLLAIQVKYCESARVNTVAFLGKLNSMQSLDAALRNFVAPIYLDHETLFSFGSSEKWSFAVYLYSDLEERLYPIWRARASNHPSQGAGRIWNRGEGHVGKAFVDQRSIITGNASAAEVADFSALPPGRGKPYDDKLYVSFASVPIGPILEQDVRPYGVIVGTSDRAGRFDKENTGILLQIAGAIASLLIACEFDIDKVEGSPTRGPAKDDHDGGEPKTADA